MISESPSQRANNTDVFSIWWHHHDFIATMTEIRNVILVMPLTHWGRVTHICFGNLTIIGSNNGLSPGRCQAITWTNAGILLIGPLWTHFSEIVIEIYKFSFTKKHFKLLSPKWQPFCLGLHVLTPQLYISQRTNWSSCQVLTRSGSAGVNLIRLHMAVGAFVYPVEYRSKNRHRNLLVGQCFSFWWLHGSDIKVQLIYLKYMISIWVHLNKYSLF